MALVPQRPLARDLTRPTGPGWTIVRPILVHWLRLTSGFRFRAWRRAAPFTGRRSAAPAGRAAAWRSAANRASKIAPTLALGRLECNAAGVNSFGVEHRSVTGRVGRRQSDTVFTHADDELCKRRFGCCAVEAPGACEATAPAFPKCFLILRAADALRKLESPCPARRACLPGGTRTGRWTICRWRGQRDPLFREAGSQRGEAARSGSLCAFGG